MELKEYIKSNFSDVRIIGEVNPSIIVRYGDVSFVFYENKGARTKKYIMCCGENRVEFDDPIESYNILIKQYSKIRQAEHYAEQK